MKPRGDRMTRNDCGDRGVDVERLELPHQHRDLMLTDSREAAPASAPFADETRRRRPRDSETVGS